mgnify:CR=1 FL=1
MGGVGGGGGGGELGGKGEGVLPTATLGPQWRLCVFCQDDAAATTAATATKCTPRCVSHVVGSVFGCYFSCCEGTHTAFTAHLVPMMSGVGRWGGWGRTVRVGGSASGHCIPIERGVM